MFLFHGLGTSVAGSVFTHQEVRDCRLFNSVPCWSRGLQTTRDLCNLYIFYSKSVVIYAFDRFRNVSQSKIDGELPMSSW